MQCTHSKLGYGRARAKLVQLNSSLIHALCIADMHYVQFDWKLASISIPITCSIVMQAILQA